MFYMGDIFHSVNCNKKIRARICLTEKISTEQSTAKRKMLLLLMFGQDIEFLFSSLLLRDCSNVGDHPGGKCIISLYRLPPAFTQYLSSSSVQFLKDQIARFLEKQQSSYVCLSLNINLKTQKPEGNMGFLMWENSVVLSSFKPNGLISVGELPFDFLQKF